MKKIRNTIIANLCVIFAVIGYISLVIGPVNAQPQEYYQIVADGKSYGCYTSEKEAVQAVADARRKANEESEKLILSDFLYEIKQIDKKPKLSNRDDVKEICQVMLDNKLENIVAAYVLKTDGYSVVLEDKYAVFCVLDKVVNMYDTYDEFSITMDDIVKEGQNIIMTGIAPVTADLTGNITSMSFVQNVTAVQAHVNADEIVSVDDAAAAIIAENRINIFVTERQQYVEEYTFETEYIEIDDWYTSEKEVVQEGSTGVHDVTALVTYMNGAEVGREIIADNIISEPVSRIVKIGVKERPTFVKPIRGGSFSSSFGSRWGRKHEGVDWSCSVGTAILASSKGKVSFAGWQNGYGNTIVINHGNGLRTKYAHLSRIAVSAGQAVEQGQSIGYSGNTGNSTGPHLHFEILLDGEPVNPMNYL